VWWPTVRSRDRFATGKALGRDSHWLVPVVFIGVGVLILTTSGTLTAIAG
jgi:cadmium resistance protein CadD (predicted permease)